LRAPDPPFGAAAELSAPVSWALQNGSIWRVMIGMGGYGIRTEHTVYSLIQCLEDYLKVFSLIAAPASCAIVIK
jgi:hypothetical protein